MPDSFDAEGLAALLRRVRDHEELVLAPMFERDLEQPPHPRGRAVAEVVLRLRGPVQARDHVVQRADGPGLDGRKVVLVRHLDDRQQPVDVGRRGVVGLELQRPVYEWQTRTPADVSAE